MLQCWLITHLLEDPSFPPSHVEPSEPGAKRRSHVRCPQEERVNFDVMLRDLERRKVGMKIIGTASKPDEEYADWSKDRRNDGKKKSVGYRDDEEADDFEDEDKPGVND